MISRRRFLARGATAALAAGSTGYATRAMAGNRRSTFVEILRLPDAATAYAGLTGALVLEPSGAAFAARDVQVRCRVSGDDVQVGVHAQQTALTHLHLRWHANVPAALQLLGDAWERSYGDLAWRGMTPERAMPWYFATHDGAAVHAYGVRTGAAAMCFWQADPEGISLWLDLSNGGDGVRLSGRELNAATILSRRGSPGEPASGALRDFCKVMSPGPRSPGGAVYGGNDWYSAYGNNSQDMLLGIADLIADLSPTKGARPFVVVDMGWKDDSPTFPSMAKYAEQVRRRGVRPGIWIRPFEATAQTPENLLLPSRRFGTRSERFRELAFDPTIPEGLAEVQKKLEQLKSWGFDLVKHDFSTYDLLGRWGFEMGAQPATPGWHFHDQSRTNAEIISGFYKLVRTTLGESTQILGCNTVGHLAAGIFELQRSGDDTSGRAWERTRRMGVNTLAYRLPQHGTFFHLDPDCVGITRDVPWKLNAQWLDLVSRTGTALFVSPAQDGSVGREQRAALREAFARVVSQAVPVTPNDFFHDTTPETWNIGKGQIRRYQWCAENGALPFEV